MTIVVILNTEANQFEPLKGLLFYDWSSDSPKFSQSKNLPTGITFNDVLGLPQKNGQSYPLFDYEQMLYDTLMNHKHV
jgi:hypothetical protein